MMLQLDFLIFWSPSVDTSAIRYIVNTYIQLHNALSKFKSLILID